MTSNSAKTVLKKIGLAVALIAATLFVLILLAILLKQLNLPETVATGVPEILVLYFWGGYFLRKKRWSKAFGIFLFSIAILLNLVFISSPYDTSSEFRATRIFLLFPVLAGIFLIFQPSKLLRLIGVFTIFLSFCAALLGAIFIYGVQ